MDVASILIVRPSSIGDIVMASPMLPVLRRAYPRAHIAWLVEPALSDLLRAHPDLDEVICWSKGNWRGLWRQGRFATLLKEMRDFSGQLKKRRFDWCLDGQGLLRSRLLCRLSGARERIGFASKEPGRRLMTRLISRGPDSKEMGSEYRHLMWELGIDPGDFAPSLHLAEDDVAEAGKALRGAGIGGDFAVLAPFTTRPQKHWFDERWAELGQRLGQERELPVLVLGGPGDRSRGGRICQKGGAGMVNLAGETSLAQSAALVERARLVVGVDTGLTHMGTAFRRPTVALFGSTCPYLETPSPMTRVLYQEFPCSPCKRRPVCDDRFDCMAALTVEKVLAAARRLVDQAAERQ